MELIINTLIDTQILTQDERRLYLEPRTGTSFDLSEPPMALADRLIPTGEVARDGRRVLFLDPETGIKFDLPPNFGQEKIV